MVACLFLFVYDNESQKEKKKVTSDLSTVKFVISKMLWNNQSFYVWILELNYQEDLDRSKRYHWQCRTFAIKFLVLWEGFFTHKPYQFYQKLWLLNCRIWRLPKIFFVWLVYEITYHYPPTSLIYSKNIHLIEIFSGQVHWSKVVLPSTCPFSSELLNLWIFIGH